MKVCTCATLKHHSWCYLANPQAYDLREELDKARARIATLEEALKRVHSLVTFDLAEPPNAGTLVEVATVIEEVPGLIAERGGL